VRYLLYLWYMSSFTALAAEPQGVYPGPPSVDPPATSTYCGRSADRRRLNETAAESEGATYGDSIRGRRLRSVLQSLSLNRGHPDPPSAALSLAPFYRRGCTARTCPTSRRERDRQTAEISTAESGGALSKRPMPAEGTAAISPTGCRCPWLHFGQRVGSTPVSRCTSSQSLTGRGLGSAGRWMTRRAGGGRESAGYVPIEGAVRPVRPVHLGEPPPTPLPSRRIMSPGVLSSFRFFLFF